MFYRARISHAAAEGRGFRWIDLTQVSRSKAGRTGWTADDGLHPADAQYRAWADWIFFHVAAGMYLDFSSEMPLFLRLRS